MLPDERQVYSNPINLMMANLPVMILNLLEVVFERAPDIQVVKPQPETSSVEDFLTTSEVDVALLGVSTHQSAAAMAQILQDLRKRNPKTRFLILTEKPSYAQTIALFRTGASGIIVGDELKFDLLCKSIRCVHNGHVWANNEVQKHLVESLGRPRPQNITDSKGVSLLTNRELEVLRLLADGLSNSELAATLRLSEHTIKNHLFKIYEKLGVSNRMEAVLYFLTPPTWKNDTTPQTSTN